MDFCAVYLLLLLIFTLFLYHFRIFTISAMSSGCVPCSPCEGNALTHIPPLDAAVQKEAFNACCSFVNLWEHSLRLQKRFVDEGQGENLHLYSFHPNHEFILFFYKFMSSKNDCKVSGNSKIFFSYFELFL